VKIFGKGWATTCPHIGLLLNHICFHIYLNLCMCIWGVWVGLSPSPRFYHSFPCDHTTRIMVRMVFQMVSALCPTLVIPQESCNEGLILHWDVAIWPPCAQHLRLWGLSSLTVRKFGMNFVEMHMCAGFRHGKCPEARLLTQEVRIGEPETTSLKEENGRRPNFFIFWPNEVPKKPS
jgi:hypothetical protein